MVLGLSNLPAASTSGVRPIQFTNNRMLGQLRCPLPSRIRFWKLTVGLQFKSLSKTLELSIRGSGWIMVFLVLKFLEDITGNEKNFLKEERLVLLCKLKSPISNYIRLVSTNFHITYICNNVLIYLFRGIICSN